MKVKLTKMRYIQGEGRRYAGEIINWPYEKLGRDMVQVNEDAKPDVKVEEPLEPVALSEIQGGKKRGPKKRVSDEGVIE